MVSSIWPKNNNNEQMKVSPAKENILKKIRKALSHSTPIPFPQSEGNSSVFQPTPQELEVEFARRFTNLQGKFIFCVNHQELVTQLNALAGNNKWDKIVCRDGSLKKVFSEQRFDNHHSKTWPPAMHRSPPANG